MDGAEIRAILAKNIKTFRGQRNWSQADLAEKSGLSIVYLSDIERGNKWPYLDTMLKLANALNIEFYELLKPEGTLPPMVSSVLFKYTEDVAAVFAKSLEITEKNISQALASLRNHYLAKNCLPLA